LVLVERRRYHMAKSASSSSHHERGCLLTGFLVLVIAINLIRTVILYVASQDAVEENFWFYGASILLGLTTIVAAFGMWSWKRWGLGLYIVVSLIGMVISLVVTGWPLILFYDTIPLLILGAAVAGRLDWFE
jgi:hypothetical protein